MASFSIRIILSIPFANLSDHIRAPLEQKLARPAVDSRLESVPYIYFRWHNLTLRLVFIAYYTPVVLSSPTYPREFSAPENVPSSSYM